MDQRDVYESRADLYDRLVTAEDCDGRLPATLTELASFAGARVVDVGAGTGRMARIALGLGARHVTLVEPARAMLAVARRRLPAGEAEFIEAPASAMPLCDASFDIATVGWVFGHLRHWFENDWRARIHAALGEVRRVVRPGGTLILLETMGTRAPTPGPPNAELAEYYGWLERDGGFGAPRVIRTDYRFESVADAGEVLSGFFGEPMGERVRRAGQTRVEESTAIWRVRR